MKRCLGWGVGAGGLVLLLHVAVDLPEAAPRLAQVAVVVGVVDPLDHRVVLLLEHVNEALHVGDRDRTLGGSGGG